MSANYLAIKNAHPRDAFITFDEGPHIYTVHGEQGYTSVTTWNHSHFPHFDAERTVDNIMGSRKMADPKYKYFGKSRDDILDDWENNRSQAARAGTAMHLDIEHYYNQLVVQNTSVEFDYFHRFVQDLDASSDGKGTLRPYRTEWMIYYEELKLSGSVDMVFENPDGTIQIYDWKRCKEIAYENDFGKSALTPCIAHLPDTNFWHYSLQLNTYKAILEAKYGKKVTGLYLICLHPDNVYKTYERIQVPFLEKEIQDLFKVRCQEISMDKTV